LRLLSILCELLHQLTRRLHPTGHCVHNIEAWEFSVGLQEHCDSLVPVRYFGEVVPFQGELVGTEWDEPLQRVGNVVEARGGVEIVPVDEAYGVVVVPDEVPGAGIAPWQ